MLLIFALISALVLGTLSGILFHAFWQERRRGNPAECPRCGYLREGLAPGEVCPECGPSIDPTPSLRRIGLELLAALALIPTPQLAVWLLVVARRELYRASKIDLLGFLSSYWGLWAVATAGAYLLALVHTAVVLRVSRHLYPGVLMFVLLACVVSDYYALRKLLLSLMLFYS